MLILIYWNLLLEKIEECDRKLIENFMKFQLKFALQVSYSKSNELCIVGCIIYSPFIHPNEWSMNIISLFSTSIASKNLKCSFYISKIESYKWV